MKMTRLALALGCAFAASAFAADTGKILKGKDIKESTLIEALTPAEDAEPTVRTRSIRVTRDQQPGAAPERPLQAAKKAQASLLITFETNSADLTARAKSSLDVVAKALQADKLADFKFSIEGHADPRGGSEYNQQLSQARAESVVSYLVNQHGIARERLKPIGKGDTEPANTKNPDAPENRRVTITTIRE